LAVTPGQPKVLMIEGDIPSRQILAAALGECGVDDVPRSLHEDAMETAVREPERPDCPVFDRAALMERLMEDEELARTILEGFLDDIPPRIEEIRASLEQSKGEALRRQVHAIKGAAGNVGGMALRQAAIEVEEAAAVEDLDRLPPLVSKMEGRFRALREIIVQFCAKGDEA
jgi:HPt (histidine-containing phosphotransfer) domain-containing protein